jgi:hypothetical protein
MRPALARSIEKAKQNRKDGERPQKDEQSKKREQRQKTRGGGA